MPSSSTICQTASQQLSLLSLITDTVNTQSGNGVYNIIYLVDKSSISVTIGKFFYFWEKSHYAGNNIPRTLKTHNSFHSSVVQLTNNFFIVMYIIFSCSYRQEGGCLLQYLFGVFSNGNHPLKHRFFYGHAQLSLVQQANKCCFLLKRWWNW